MQNLAISKDSAGARGGALALRKQLLATAIPVRGREHPDTIRALPL